MLLAIDVGNTNSVFALYDGKNWVGQWRGSTDATRTADEYAVWLIQLMGLEGRTFADITACVISSVVPQALFNFRNLTRRLIHKHPREPRRRAHPRAKEADGFIVRITNLFLINDIAEHF